MELKNLNNYLSSKFSFKNSSTLKCNNCESFIGTNLKSLAVHKRKCKGKQNNDTNIKNINEQILDEYNNDNLDIKYNNFDDNIDSLKNSDQKTKENILEQIEEFERSTTEEINNEKQKKIT